MIKDCFKQAQLAVAAYADLISGRPDQTALIHAGMTEAQSADFAAYWRVVEQYTDALTGVSATLFQPTTGGAKYLAVRGAPEPLDSVPDACPTPDAALRELGPQYQQLRSRVQDWLEQGALGAGFTVTGHGHGGYLAAALVADFAADISRAYLYYAHGSDDAIGHIVQALGVDTVPSAEKISRFPPERRAATPDCARPDQENGDASVSHAPRMIRTRK